MRTIFEDDGFAFAALLVNALDYGLPQARKRVYLVAVPLDHELLQVVPTAGFTTELEAMMKSLILSMRPLGLFLLPDDDPCLQRELERLQHAKAQAKDKLEKDTKWQDDHQRVFKSHGFVWGKLRPPLKVASSPWFQIAQPREKDILTLIPHIHPDARRCDVGQSIGRCRASSRAHSNTCTPGMKIFDFERNRFWVGRESLKLQGIDWEEVPNLDQFADSDLADLGGNAFAAPCFMAVFLTTLSTLVLGTATNKMDGKSALQSLMGGSGGDECGDFSEESLLEGLLF